MTPFSTLDKTASPVDLDAEQVVAATEFYAENQTDIERGRNSDNFVEYYKTSLTHVRGTPMSGVFSETAYQLFFGEFMDNSDASNHVRIEWYPLLIDQRRNIGQPRRGNRRWRATLDGRAAWMAMKQLGAVPMGHAIVTIIGTIGEIKLRTYGACLETLGDDTTNAQYCAFRNLARDAIQRAFSAEIQQNGTQ